MATPLRTARPQAPGTGDVPLSPVQQRLAQIMATADDLSAASDSLELAARTWEERYHLSPQRGTILQALPIAESPTVLEIGARCGGLTRHLGELGGLVDAVEPQPAMARLARTRCADLPGVVVHETTLAAVPVEPAYDLVVAVDALDLLADEGMTIDDLLMWSAALLRPGGMVLVAGDNTVGVRFRAGDSTPLLHRVDASALPRLSRADVEASAVAAGLVATTLRAFPDHRHAKLLYDHDAVVELDPGLLAVLPSFPSPPYLERTAEFPERQLWAEAVHDGTAAEHANAVVVLAAREPVRIDAAAAYWSAGRSVGQSAFNRIRRHGDDIVVERALRFPDTKPPAGPLRLRPQLEPYVDGARLVRLLSESTSLERAAELLHPWRDLVHEACRDRSTVPWDLIPRNVMVTDDGLAAFDQEWELDGGDAATVLARGCFWLAYDLGIAGPRPCWLPATTVAATAHLIADLAGCSLPADWIGSFIDHESVHMSYVWPTDARHSRSARARKEWHQLTDLSRTELPRRTGADHSADSSGQDASDAVIEALTTTNAALQQRISELELELRHSALVHRDHAIGLMTTAETFRTRHEMAQSSLRRARTKITRLQKRNAEMRASLTWRIGSLFVRPISRLRRR
jgi:SAM-dependent methyltransferase